MKIKILHKSIRLERFEGVHFVVIIIISLLLNSCAIKYPYYYHSEKLKLDMLNPAQKSGFSIDTILFYSARISQSGHYLVRLPYDSDSLFAMVSSSLSNHKETLEVKTEDILRIEKGKAFLNHNRRRKHIISLANEHLPSGTGSVLVTGIEYVLIAEQAGGGGLEFAYYTGDYYHYVRYRLFLIGLDNGTTTYFDEIGRVTSLKKDNHMLLPYKLKPEVSDSLVDNLVNSRLMHLQSE